MPGGFALFAYGSLELDEVIEAVTGARFSATPARLRGYRRELLRGLPYPAIVPDPRASTGGILYEGLTHEAIARVDAFEADAYDRVRVDVMPVGASSPEGASVVSAQAYVLRARYHDRLSGVAWDREAFRRDHLAAFLDDCGFER